MHEIFPVRVQSFEQSRRKAAGRTEPRTCGNVGHAGDLEIAGGDADESQRFANNGMSYFVNGRSFFHPRVLQQKTFNEARMNVDVHVLVDRSRDQEAPMLP